MRSETIYGLTPRTEGNSAFAAALDYYLFALLAIEQHAIEIEGTPTRTFRLGLRSLHRELIDHPDHATADKSQGTLTGLLKAYQGEFLGYMNQKDVELRDILSVLSVAAETISAQNNQHNTRLKAVTQQLQIAARSQDICEVRRSLTQQVAELRNAIETMWSENQSCVTNLQGQLSHFQRRLEAAEKLASIDGLTGLLNRREGEARLNEKVRRGRPFCLIVLDLDRFKSINDEMGHGAGDQVLRLFTKRLSELVRPSDLVARWGGDEFILTMDCGIEIAESRAAQVRSELNGRYKIVVIGKEFTVSISASFGIAEFIPGETLEQLFVRADETLYEHKKAPASKVILHGHR